jgi:hypothetical protein
MKTLYAIILACLSVPALAWEPEIYNSACPEYGLTAFVNEPATSIYDYAVDDSIDFEGYTATVISPASKPITDMPVDSSIRFFSDDDGFDFTAPGAIEFAIQASDWWG